MSATAMEGASMMAKASKRVKSPNWDDRETMSLAKLKREAFRRGEEGRHVWQDISQKISGRSAIQCRRRWETLVKVYDHVKDFCTQTGQDHEEIDDAELASMKLETAYRREWYMIVQEVCRERKRRRICDGGAAAMLSKKSRTPVMETLQASTHHATTDSPVDTSPDSEVCSQRKRRRICDRRSAMMLSKKGISTAVMETLPTTHFATTDIPVTTSPENDFENIATSLSRGTVDFGNHVGQLTISTVRWAPHSPRQDTMASSLSGWVDATDELNVQVFEQTWLEVEFLVPESSWPECPRHEQGLLNACNFTFNCFSPPISFPQCVFLQCSYRVIELGVELCCNGCVSKLRKHIAKVDGIQKVIFNVDCHKVIVTARAEPEVVLKYAQMAMAKKEVVLLSSKKLIAPKS